MKLAYEGEETFIEDIQDVRKLLKSKGVTVGISESIECNTHFVKIFCDDQDYTEKLKGTIYQYISNVLYKVVVEAFRRKEMLEYLTENYFFLRHDEMVEIDRDINNILSGDEKIKDETTIYCLNRVNYITDSIKEFIEETGGINITGFITFRMKALTKYIEDIIDKVIEKYMVEKEYNEFIKLLKYFVDIQECKMDEVNLIVLGNGGYDIKDNAGEDVFKEFLKEMSDNPQNKSANIEDIIISGLITNAPRRINIFNELLCNNQEFLKTIKSVFGERVKVYSEQKIT